MIILSHKKAGYHPLSRKKIFKNTIERGVTLNSPLPYALLGLKMGKKKITMITKTLIKQIFRRQMFSSSYIKFILNLEIKIPVYINSYVR